ncbi:MAG TPA: universal stress protein [Rhodopila sp.]|nr:universal stress protein [Rhodopila sp.]
MFKYILVPIVGDSVDRPILETALTTARLSAAHLACLHVRSDVQQRLVAIANSGDMGGVADLGSTIETLEQRAGERQRKAASIFEEFCAAANLTVSRQPQAGRPSAELMFETGEDAPCVAAYGRGADLVVIGDTTMSGWAVVEAALLGTGRPVLLAPPQAPSRIAGTVAIAWKDTAETARAVTAAMPFIEMAQHVIIFVVEEQIELGEKSATRLRAALSWHGPNVSVERLPQDGRPPVETLLAALDGRADLLVMGAYGRSRLRQVIFGGFTRHILNGVNLPVLMSH